MDSSWPPLPSTTVSASASTPVSPLTDSTSVTVSPLTVPASVSTALVTPSPPSLTSTAPPFSPLPPVSSPMPYRVSPYPKYPVLYSPSVGITASPSDSSPGTDHILRELRSSMTYCMERFQAHDEQVVVMIKNFETLATSLNSVISQQGQTIQSFHAMNKQKDAVISKLSEDLARLTSQFQTHVHIAPPPVPDPQVQEQIATIQTEVQRHSEWVEVARKAPPRSATVSETIAESERRTQRSLNLRVRGIEKVASATPLQQAVEFVTQTMDIADHGVVSAYRAGGDPARPQSLIMRFRDAETRLAVLRRRRRLSEFPQIHLDEDLTPLQWQIYRDLLPQRHTARQEGLWAVIRDGRLITRPLRTTRGGADDRERTENSDEGRQIEKEA